MRAKSPSRYRLARCFAHLSLSLVLWTFLPHIFLHKHVHVDCGGHGHLYDRCLERCTRQRVICHGCLKFGLDDCFVGVMNTLGILRKKSKEPTQHRLNM